MIKSNGFTLVELLVVIAVIIILSTIGLGVYKDVAGKARDAQRKSDIDAIAKAYENSYTPDGYRELMITDFTKGNIPTPPEGGNYDGEIHPPASSPRMSSFVVCARLEGFEGSDSCTPSGQYCYCISSAQSR